MSTKVTVFQWGPVLETLIGGNRKETYQDICYVKLLL